MRGNIQNKEDVQRLMQLTQENEHQSIHVDLDTSLGPWEFLYSAGIYHLGAEAYQSLRDFAPGSALVGPAPSFN